MADVINPDIKRRWIAACLDSGLPPDRFFALITPAWPMIDKGAMIRWGNNGVIVEPPPPITVLPKIIDVVDCCASCKYGERDGDYAFDGHDEVWEDGNTIKCNNKGHFDSHSRYGLDPYSLCNLYERSTDL